jgi:hypothetical protein
VHVPAAAARAQRQARVEALDGRLQLPLDVGHVHRHLVEEPIAALAEPEERLGLLGPALDLDHEPPRVSGAVGRMRNQGGQQAHLALADDPLVPPAILHVLEAHRAPEHVEDLVGGVHVEVTPGVRPADDHRGELRVLPDHLVADRRLEAGPVLLDPAPQVEGDEATQRGHLRR